MNKSTRIKRWLINALIGVVLLGSASCSNTKYLPAGESLFIGSKVKVDAPSLKKKQKKNLQSQLQALTRPKPNSTILGLRIKLYAYNIAGHPKKKHSPAAWLKNKFGEPPVLLSDLNLQTNTKILQNNLENQGFFQANVKGDTVIKKRRATALYTVQTNDQYTINQVIYQNDSSDLTKAIAKLTGESLLKKGDPFNLDVIKAERDRIDAELKEQGFYYFNPDFLIIRADTNNGKNTVDMHVDVKSGTPKQGERIYTINDVFVFTQFSLNSAGSDTNKRNATLYKGYYVVDKRKLYKPSMFEQSMQFSPGDVYSRTDHNQSLNRLINLGLFRFVKNRFEEVPGDSSKLNTLYYLTPLPKQSLRLELGADTKSNNLTGSQVTLGWKNRNFFKGGELLTVNATGGFEVQYGGQLQGYNTYRGSLEGNLTYPRYLIPFFNINPNNGYVPKTTIMLAYDALNKNKLYTLNQFRGSYGYTWKKNPLKEFQFNPISINYVQPLNVTQQYLDSIKSIPTLRRTIDKQFIIGSNYNYNYNQLAASQPKNGIYFNGNLDLSGNILGAITGANFKSGDSVKIFNALFSQYARAEADFRFYRKLGGGAVWANRIIAGFGLPYGNSTELPYIKQFFVGGNNSIRAFRSRSLGPGTYHYADSLNKFYPDQTGDIKLEMNTELRRKLFSIVQGAVFVDAGNIWLYNDNPDSTQVKPGGKFTKDFLRELAVGAGVGLRFDVTILVLRLDLAFPLRKPWYPEGHRWVLDEINFLSSSWRKENLVLNLGIGYPF